MVPVSRKLISRNRQICFGKFVLDGIAITAIVERHEAGESVRSIGKDYGLSRSEILGAIAWHKKKSKAAKKGWRTRRRNVCNEQDDW